MTIIKYLPCKPIMHKVVQIKITHIISFRSINQSKFSLMDDKDKSSVESVLLLRTVVLKHRKYINIL